MRRILLGLAVGAIGYCLIFRADAQDIKTSTGLVCNKAEQVEEVGALFASNGMQGAIEAVNAKDVNACGIISVAYYTGKNIKRIQVAGRGYQISEIWVIAIEAGGQWQKLKEPELQFAPFTIEENPA